MQKRGLYITLFILFAGLAYSACPPPGAPTHDTLYVNTLKPIGGDCESPINLLTTLYVPFIYDKDDAAYYLNPAGTTKLNALTSNSVSASTVAAGSFIGTLTGDVSCTGCIGSAEIQNDAITEDDISNSFVARDSELLDGRDSSGFAASMDKTGNTIRLKNPAGGILSSVTDEGGDADWNLKSGFIQRNDPVAIGGPVAWANTKLDVRGNVFVSKLSTIPNAYQGSGSVNAKSLCIEGNCRTSWPTDTNAQTKCGNNAYLRGDGSCIDQSTIAGVGGSADWQRISFIHSGVYKGKVSWICHNLNNHLSSKCSWASGGCEFLVTARHITPDPQQGAWFGHIYYEPGTTFYNVAPYGTTTYDRRVWFKIQGHDWLHWNLHDNQNSYSWGWDSRWLVRDAALNAEGNQNSNVDQLHICTRATETRVWIREVNY